MIKFTKKDFSDLRDFVERHPLGAVDSTVRDTVAVCMITRSCFKGLERALRSVHEHVDAVYVGVDDRDEDKTLEKLPTLLKELNLTGNYKAFKAADPWDFSFARNIVHQMSTCDWALSIDDDEYVEHPEELREMMTKLRAADAINVTCGMGVDEYKNVSHTWKFPRLIRKHVMWKNARHNIPNPELVKQELDWQGNFIIVDDKSIKEHSH